MRWIVISRCVLWSALVAGAVAACSSSEEAGKPRGGCTDDTDCSDDRVCEDGECVEWGGAVSGAGTGGSTGSGGAAASTGTGMMTEPGGPKFLSFATNVTSLTEGESVTFTAVLTDPDGVDDVIGGSLKDPSDASYGAFATSGQEGSYEMTIQWAQIQQLSSIDFAQGKDGQRTFIAEFFDARGHAATNPVTLTLTCNGIAACKGSCTDVMIDHDNCGSCGAPAPSFRICQGGKPTCPIAGEQACGNACVDLKTDSAHCGTCANDCDALPPPDGYSRSCYGGQCGFVPIISAWNDWPTLTKSCQTMCAEANGTCTTVDWSTVDPSVPCGTSTGCFFYGDANNDPACRTELTCGLTPTKKTGCQDLWSEWCFCN